MLTENEKNVLRFLVISLKKHYSINEIARRCRLAPNGAFKILRKLEREHIVKAEHIANIKSYALDFGNEKTTAVIELAFMQDLEGRVKYRASDLKPLKETTKACIIFGSYLNKSEANDLDVLFVLDKVQFRHYKDKLKEISCPVKIHDVVQTMEDLKKNIIKRDDVIMDLLKKGMIIWGHEVLVEVIKNAAQE